jgi:large subunit ribosomal protein L23
MPEKITNNLLGILIKPIVTEKTEQLKKKNIYTFKVNGQANKKQIKQAVETFYNVKVEKVTTIFYKSKPRRYRFRIGRTSTYKKAYVKLKEGYKIAVY